MIDSTRFSRFLSRALTASVCAAGLTITSTSMLHAQEAAKPGKIDPVAPTLDRPIDYDKDIQPIFDEKCVSCHNIVTPESKLNLEDAASLFKGGKRGPTVIPKDVEKSLLYLVAARVAEPAMPPLPNKASATAVTPQELGLIKKWIEEGAPAGSASEQQSVSWQAIPSNMHSIYSVAVSKWGQWAACSRANQIDLYDLTTGEYAGRLQDPALTGLKKGDKPFYPHGAAHRDVVHALAFSPDGNLLASGGYREVKLWQRSASTPVADFAQDQAINSVTISPNGVWLAIGRADNTVVVQQIAKPDSKRTLIGHTAAITGLQFSPDSTRLFTSSNDKSVRIWNVADGQQAGYLETPHEVTSLVLNLDGTRVFTGHAGDFVARGWAVPFETPKPAEGDKPAEPVKPVIEFKGHSGAITAVALHKPAGTHLVTTSADSTWRIWEIANGNQTVNQNHGATITGLSLKSDGQFVVTTGANNLARLWKIDGTAVADLKGSLSAQRHVINLTDDDTIAKSRVQLADASFKAAEKNYKEREEGTKKAIEQKTAAETALNDAKTKEQAAKTAVEAAKTELAAKADDEALKKKVADAEAAATKETEALKKAQDAFDGAVKGVAQSEKGQQSADEQQKQAKALFDAETNVAKAAEATLNKAKTDLPAVENKAIKSAAFIADGKLIATCSDDGSIRIWGGTTGKPIEEIAAKAPVSLLTSGPSNTFVSASDDKHVVVWNSNSSWNLVATIGPPPENTLDLAKSQFQNRVLALAFSPDSKLLATGGGEPSRSGELILWNVGDRSLSHTFVDAHSDTVFTIDFSRDGKYLISGAADKFVKQFDVATHKHVRSFEGHTHHVLGVSMKGDGSRIASAGADNAIKVWNVETGEQHRTILNYTKQVSGVHYMGATDNLISASGDKHVKMHRSNDGNNYRTFVGATDFLHAVAATRDESIVAAGGEDGVFRIWNGADGKELYKFEVPKTPDNSQASIK